MIARYRNQRILHGVSLLNLNEMLIVIRHKLAIPTQLVGCESMIPSHFLRQSIAFTGLFLLATIVGAATADCCHLSLVARIAPVNLYQRDTIFSKEVFSPNLTHLRNTQ